DRTTWCRRALARTGYEVALSADELDDADVVAATMELAARTGGRVSFGDVADAVDELTLSRDPETADTTAGRAAALAELAARLPGGEDELELARRREVDRLSGRPGTDGRVSELVSRYPGMLS